MLAEVNSVDSEQAAELIGLLIIVACLIGAGVVAYRTRDWLVPLILCGVALVAAVLLV